ncbi:MULTISPECIES: hypothetical protein [Mycobacteriaceae]|uniref:Uncharacterized protein n=1 Tax=Mycolicibacterium parafortuitum TaxID=39692 RepID=A0ACC6MFV4_MYCPF|nr:MULTISPECIES: hypothetical protein [Mycobacteriaceae]MDZ5085861.1 hypothetical protein [Mycolicibacterium parafortuitum]GFM18827.1 IgA1 protease [Mycobacterium sp. PO1]GFM24725.1 IgA1 protease [Mycobacterium sp. PO2]
MGTVMGLSLTADMVGWVLVDVDAGGLLDHDVLEVTAGAEIAGAAVLGAHAIAATAGHEIDRVRITWSDDAGHDGLRLQSRLRSLALSPVEAVPQSRALAVLVDPEDADLPVDIALAYGAAMAAADHDETIPDPVGVDPVRRSPARRLLTSALGVAAAVAIGVFFLGAAGGPDVAPAATAVEQPSAAEPGWVAVPVTPPNTVTIPARKVVAVPSPRSARPEPVSSYQPAQSAATVPAPQVAPAPAAVTAAEPEGQPLLSETPPEVVPHLGGQQPEAVPQLGTPQPGAVPHHGGPQPDAVPPLGGSEPRAVTQPDAAGPVPAAPVGTMAEPAAVPHVSESMSPHAPGPSTVVTGGAPAPEMTDSANLFTALP